MGGGFGKLDDLFRSEPRFEEGDFALLRGMTAGGTGGRATGRWAGTTTVGTVGRSEGVEGETQSSRFPLIGAGGGVAAVSFMLTSVSEMLWGRRPRGFLLGLLRLDADDCELAGDGSCGVCVDVEMLAVWI